MACQVRFRDTEAVAADPSSEEFRKRIARLRCRSSSAGRVDDEHFKLATSAVVPVKSGRNSAACSITILASLRPHKDWPMEGAPRQGPTLGYLSSRPASELSTTLSSVLSQSANNSSPTPRPTSACRSDTRSPLAALRATLRRNLGL